MAQAQQPAPKPSLAWRSWEAYYQQVDAEKLLAAARVMVTPRPVPGESTPRSLRDLGFARFGVDDGWWVAVFIVERPVNALSAGKLVALGTTAAFTKVNYCYATTGPPAYSVLLLRPDLRLLTRPLQRPESR